LCGRRKSALVHLPLFVRMLLIRSILSTILSALRHTLEFADQALSILKFAKVKGHLMLFAGEPRDEDIILAY
jgi:hypothetical protein